MFLSFAQEVEHFEYLFFRGLFVDLNVSDVSEECEVDVACFILLVVLHELVQSA